MATPPTIHELLARSYLAHFLASILGLCVDSFVFIPFHIPHASALAIVLFALGPLLILWAQLTSRHVEKAGHPRSRYFDYGPYRFVRNPTHLGLLMLVTGYALVSGALIFFATTFLGYVVSSIFFGKYEQALQGKYDGDYEHYKSKVNKIL